MRACALSRTLYTGSSCQSLGHRTNQTLVDDRLAKQIAAQQATPLHSHVNPNDQSALRLSVTHSATGDAIIDAICARIGIQNDIDSILALGKSPLEVNGVLLKVGSQRLHFRDAKDKIGRDGGEVRVMTCIRVRPTIL